MNAHQNPPILQGEQRFDGATFEPDMDGQRLTTQLNRVAAVMWNGEWFTLAEIAKRVSYPPYEKASEAGVSARLRDLRKPRFGGYQVERRRKEGCSGTFEYRLIRRDQ